MKKLLALGVALAVSAPAFSNDGLFVGIGIGNTKLSYDYKDNYFGESGSDSESDTSFYIRGGKFFRDDIRAYVDLTKVDYDGADQLSVTASVDKLFPVAEQVDLYIGGSLGYISLDLEEASKESGVLYGAQAGALFKANKNIDVDFGFSYLLSTAEFKDSEEIMGTIYTNKVEFTDLMTFKVGVNYRF